MKSHSPRYIFATFLPTLFGLLLLLIVPIWSMWRIQRLHQRMETLVVPVHEKVEHIITRANRLHDRTSEFPFTLNKSVAEQYRREKEVWLRQTSEVSLVPLQRADIVTNWEAGVRDIRNWLQQHGDAAIREGTISSEEQDWPLFDQGVAELNAADIGIDQVEADLRGRIRELERGAAATTCGLGIVCGMLVLLSWRNAVALHRALAVASRSAERLEVAVKETNHRVKNNLQTISAIIDMNRQEYDTQIPRHVLDDIYQQVRTVAGVHDFLSHEHHANRVAVRPMLDNLVKLAAAARELKTEVTAEEADLPVKEATSVSLITNELVLNAGKHGAHCVQVVFTANLDSYQLRVSDDGPGLPADFSVETHGNLGTSLIETLVQHDLGGKVVWRNGNDLGGADVMIAFPVPISS